MDEQAAIQKENRFLETEPVGSLIRKYSIPCIISLLVGALYNIVDQLFISNASYLGSYGNAANTVVFPLTVVALAVAVMIGDGACAFVSIRLGKGEKDRARSGIGNAVTLTVAAGVLIMALYLIFAEPIVTAFGGRVNEETFGLAKEYFFWITLGIPFYVFGQGMNPVIRSDGSPRFAMVSTVAGALANVVLDPVFIYPMKMGMKGAAIATVIGQVVTAALAVWYLFHLKTVRLQKKDFAVSGETVRSMIPLGICSFLSQISLVAAMAAINNMTRKYGALDPVFGQAAYTQIPMAVIGIVMKFFQIVISIVVGMAAGCIPVVGYNVGAGRPDRTKALFLRILTAEALVGAAAFFVVMVLPNQLIRLFGAANESVYYTEFAVRAFRTYLCLVIPACVNKAAFIFLQSLGKAWTSTALSMVREVVLGVGFAILLPVRFGLSGVLYSMPVSDALTFILSMIVIVSVVRELDREIGAGRSVSVKKSGASA